MSENPKEMADYIIDVDGLIKDYGDLRAVDGISIKIPKGKIFGFLGPNGAGKTTTINCLLTLLKPTAGTGTIAGFDMYDYSKIRHKVSAVFQEQTLDETLTAMQNLTLHAQLYSIPKNVYMERINELAEMVELTERLNDPVLKFSGGMRRRLEIVRALLTEPEILFLDEPTIGLDPQSRSNIWDKILKMNKDKGITVFITTHQMDEVEAICDTINIIDKGKLIASGTAEELKESLGQDLIILQPEDRIDIAKERIDKLNGIIETKIIGNSIHISTTNGSHMISSVVETLVGNGDRIDIKSIELKKPTLNDVFLYYTGRELRDDEADLSDRLKMVGRKARRRGHMRR